MHKLVIVGFVQLIPREYEYGRFLCGLLVALLYLVLVVSTKPYKRRDIDRMAMGTQTALVLFFISALSVHLYTKLKDEYGAEATSRVLGFDDVDDIIFVMIGCNLAVLVVIYCMAIDDVIT